MYIYIYIHTHQDCLVVCCGIRTYLNNNSMCSLLFQVYKVCSDTFDSYDQHYGRGLVKDTIKDGMFFCVYVCYFLYLSCCRTPNAEMLKEDQQGFNPPPPPPLPLL